MRNSTPTRFVRLHSAEQLPLVLPLVEAFHREGHLPFDDDVTSRAVLDLLTQPHLGQIWLAYQGEAVAAYVALTRLHSIEFGGACLYFDEVYTLPAFRRQGIAASAIEQIISRCRAESVRALWLEVDRAHEPAVQLYRRFGFRDRTYVNQILQLADDLPVQAPDQKPG